MNERIDSIGRIILVFAILLGLLGFNLGTAFMRLGPWRLALQLTVAGIQDAMIWLLYMHLPEERGPTRVFALIGLIWFMILVTFTLSDFVTRGWLLFPAKWPAYMHFSPPL